MRLRVQTCLLLLTLLGGLAHTQTVPGQTSPPPPATLTAQTLTTQRTSDQPTNPSIPAPGKIIQADVAQGPLGGRERGDVRQFLGVPYAAPPLGELRWQAPTPMPAWPGRRDASHFGNVCPQRPNAITGNPDRTLSGSEDCLYLNVYAPLAASTGAAAAPMMVWVHGGSFDTGTGNIYDGSKLARDFGVVVVTLNYRLGPLGFLATPALGPQGSGNYGLMDVQAALRWVRANAAAFGGDPGNVTAFGESAGGMILCDLLTSPASKGLFDKVILQSGPCAASINSVPLAQALDIGARYTHDLNCPAAAEGAACLRSKTVAELIDMTVPGSRAPNTVALPPVWGDAVLPLEPAAAYRSGQFLKVPVMIGGNRDEGTIFTAYLAGQNRAMSLPLYWGLITVLNPAKNLTLLRQYPATTPAITGLTAATLVTDGLFACPVYSVTRQLAQSVPTYAYEFSDPQAVTELTPTRSVPSLGAYHASELIYLFGAPLEGLADPATFSATQRQLSAQMGAYWTNFARTSNPNGPGLALWTPFEVAQPTVLTLRPDGSRPGTDFAARHQCNFWDKLDGR
ncbi:carboxylesterase/lipase family protein [Deinococcus alpinitundrae]|uniref:carboxylesterase/lipase family protein n=1 Tax=Deinococcus alpinitundrae TaxID=468913 RepID=UPI00137B91F2|nr:carboxylesterase/lipase family protein [Deinococcus alpinitundrae]